MLMKPYGTRTLFSSITLAVMQYARGREVTRSLSTDAYDKLVPSYYDKYTAPATDVEPVIVYFDMKLLDITSINENDMTFSVESFVTYRWKDWRLRWPLEHQEHQTCWNPPPPNITKPLQFLEVCSGNYTTIIHRCMDSHPDAGRRIILPITYLDKIWQPDAFFKNGIRSSIHKDWVTNEYLAFYTSDGHIRLFSRMSVTLSCHFDFHHYPHDEQKCEMLIQSLSYKSDTVQFQWCESWAHAGSKLDADIFSLPHFSLAKYEHEVCNISYIKSLDIWMITCMVYVFAALLEFSIVYHVHYRRTNGSGQGIISPTPNGPSQVLGVSSERLTRWTLAWKNFWRGDTAIDEASRILFPLTYFSFVTGYFILLTGSQQQGSLSAEIPQ
ncbi:glycine receptor subunit beta-like isoform X3 [Macrobrachium nipponense]|uniref:glycine receptor subunit beta-like isoform X3 n=1 Tax=Macrobrachium nipponense TaxID=159736 RepID=UPI0030C7D469